jgi:hypothetical protein
VQGVYCQATAGSARRTLITQMRSANDMNKINKRHCSLISLTASTYMQGKSVTIKGSSERTFRWDACFLRTARTGTLSDWPSNVRRPVVGSRRSRTWLRSDGTAVTMTTKKQRKEIFAT